MEFTLDRLPRRDVYRLLSSLIIPRPIAWVTTLNPGEGVNAAPFSFFNLMGDSPPLVVLGVGDRPEGGPKDTAANLERTNECVIHLVSESMARQMNETSAALPPGESEVEAAGLALAPSVTVGVPRLAHAPAAMEGRLAQTVRIGQNRVLMVEIIHVSVNDAFVGEEGIVRAADIGLVGRVDGPSAYTRTSGDRFQIARPQR